MVKSISKSTSTTISSGLWTWIKGNIRTKLTQRRAFRSPLCSIYPYQLPYNTGGDKFIYPDDYSMSEAESDEAEGEIVDGERMRINQKSCNRFHANWLSMIYPRLRIAKDLMCDDGVIFISCDDNEISNIRKICEEIFGEENFVGQICVINNLKGRNSRKNIATCHEYALIFCKGSFEANGLPLTDEQKALFNKKDENGNDYQLRDLRKRGGPDRKEDRPNMHFPIYFNEQTGECSLEENEGWIAILPFRGDGSEGRWRWGRERVQNNLNIIEPKYSKSSQRWGVEHRVYLNPALNPAIAHDENDDINDDEERDSKSKSFWTGSELSSDIARRTFREVMGNNAFDYPKAVDTIIKMLYMGMGKNDVILDFFSGSATTAHAVMQLNAEDGGNRRFIMVQYPEICDEKSEAAKAGYPNICEIGKERIRRAGDKIKAEIEAANQQLKPNEEPKPVPDIGFRVFRTADTNIRWAHLALQDGQIEALQYDQNVFSDKDALDFMPGYTDIDVVYEILLRQRDIPLSSTVEKLNIGTRTYLFASAYVVCLEDKITTDLVERLAAVEPTPIKYIFRDSAFDDNISLKDETIRRLEAYIARNSGEQKKAYTVEFI